MRVAFCLYYLGSSEVPGLNEDTDVLPSLFKNEGKWLVHK